MIRKGFMEEVDFELRIKGLVAIGYVDKFMQTIPERGNGMNTSILLALMWKSRASISVWLKMKDD